MSSERFGVDTCAYSSGEDACISYEPPVENSRANVISRHVKIAAAVADAALSPLVERQLDRRLFGNATVRDLGETVGLAVMHASASTVRTIGELIKRVN